MELHVIYGQASTAKIKKLLLGIPDIPPELITRGEKAANLRHTCELAAAHPPIPTAGRRVARRLGSDLFFVEALIAPICVDVATRFT